MIKNFKWLLFASLSISLVACSDDDNAESVAEVPLTAGTADFSKYVALGNSLTAGFSDGALFKAGQENSYPKLMADQFSLVGGGAFKIPFTDDNIGGFSNTHPITGALLFEQRFIFDGCAPVRLPAQPTTNFAQSIATSGPFNNLGVPGAKSFHLLAPNYGNAAGVLLGTANPYFARFASNSTTSVIADAMAQSPTFFSLWIGNNDVLGYATSGGDGTNPITPLDGPAGVGFKNTYETLLNTLTTNGAKGVVANIPYVTTIPFFTTIPLKPVAPYAFFKDESEADCRRTDYPPTANDIGLINAVNANLLTPLNMILPDRFSLLSTTASNPVLIHDESLEDKSATITFAAQNSGNPQLIALAGYLGATYGQARHSKTGDLILLTTRGEIGKMNTLLPAPILAQGLGAYGITYPLPDKTVLVPAEIAELKAATDSYNIAIKTLAAAKGLAFVDANALLTQLANGGIRFNNYTMNSTFVQGGAFGLDGIHITARANAYIANKFMEAINTTYGSTLRMYSPESFPFSYPATLR